MLSVSEALAGVYGRTRNNHAELAASVPSAGIVDHFFAREFLLDCNRACLPSLMTITPLSSRSTVSSLG
jgi:hypothetical protein